MHTKLKKKKKATSIHHKTASLHVCPINTWHDAFSSRGHLALNPSDFLVGFASGKESGEDLLLLLPPRSSFLLPVTVQPPEI